MRQQKVLVLFRSMHSDHDYGSKTNAPRRWGPGRAEVTLGRVQARKPGAEFQGRDSPLRRDPTGNDVWLGGFSGRARRPILARDETAGVFFMVRCRWRGKSPSPASGFQGAAMRPLIDGCRESRSLPRVIKRRNVWMAQLRLDAEKMRHEPEGMQRGTRSGVPLAKIAGTTPHILHSAFCPMVSIKLAVMNRRTTDGEDPGNLR